MHCVYVGITWVSFPMCITEGKCIERNMFMCAPHLACAANVIVVVIVLHGSHSGKCICFAPEFGLCSASHLTISCAENAYNNNEKTTPTHAMPSPTSLCLYFGTAVLSCFSQFLHQRLCQACPCTSITTAGMHTAQPSLEWLWDIMK